MNAESLSPGAPQCVGLFAGGGGLALGLHDAGFEHEELVEWDRHACQVLRVNAKRDPSLWKVDAVYEGDVRDWLAELPKRDLDDADLVAGGPPCQPFSTAGAHAGFNDHRNMFPAAIEAVRIIKPKLVLFENVPGVLRPSFLPYYNYLSKWLANPSVCPKDGETWVDHLERLRAVKQGDIFYHVYPEEIQAADLGVPQTRKRVFMMAIRHDVNGATTWPGVTTTHSLDTLLWEQYVSGSYWDRQGLARQEVPRRYASRVRELRKLEERPEGEHWRTIREMIATLPKPVDNRDHPEVPDHRGIPGARVYKGHTGSPIDMPAKTLKAGVHGVCGGEAVIRFPDDRVRYLTVRESARAQTFHDSYVFSLARSHAMRLIGNAVSVRVAEIVGRQLLKHTELAGV